MWVPHLVQRNLGDGDGDKPSTITKTVLEWVFAISALLVVVSLAMWRYAYLRRRGAAQQLSFLPSPHPHPHPHPQNARGGSYPCDPTYAPRPPRAAATRGRRAVRGMDVDSSGRRGGPGDSDDQPHLDKDVLPAYDGSSGPPKYLEMAGLEADADGDVIEMEPMPRVPQDRSTSPNATSEPARSPARPPNLDHEGTAGPDSVSTPPTVSVPPTYLREDERATTPRLSVDRDITDGLRM